MSDYRTQLDLAVQTQERDDQRKQQEIEKLRRAASDQILNLISLLEQAQASVASPDGLYTAMECARNAQQFSTHILMDLTRAHALHTIPKNVFLHMPPENER